MSLQNDNSTSNPNHSYLEWFHAGLGIMFVAFFAILGVGLAVLALIAINDVALGC